MRLSNWSDDRVANAAGRLGDAFSGVGDAFSANFADGAENGASFAATIDGKLIIDIKGGWRERREETPWADDTISCVYSTGKAVLAFLIAVEVSKGNLDYETSISEFWPAFSANGKAEITLGDALSHQDGLVAFPEDTPPETYLDWRAACAVIEEMEPYWEPGSANGYHPQTFGFIAGEVFRRATGKSVGEALRDLNAEFGLDVLCGLTPNEMARVAPMQKPPRPPDLGDLTELKKLAFLTRSAVPARAGKDEWMAAELPASNMHANAAALARLLSPLANGGLGPNGERYLQADAIDTMFRERIRGDDLILPFHLSWSAGVMGNINRHFGPNENAFGQAGFGGSCVLIDPENRLTAAYVMNKMSPHLVGDPRAIRLIDAVYAAL